MEGEDQLVLFVENERVLDDVKDELLLRINRFKEKIDTIEPLKQHYQHYSLAELPVMQKNQIKYIQTEMDVLERVLQKLRSENMTKYDGFKSTIIRNITIQITRYNRIIPEEINENVNQSRIRNPAKISKIKKFDLREEEKSKQDNIYKSDIRINQLLRGVSTAIESKPKADNQEDEQISKIPQLSLQHQRSSLQQKQIELQRMNSLKNVYDEEPKAPTTQPNLISDEERQQRRQRTQRNIKRGAIGVGCCICGVLVLIIFIVVQLLGLGYKLLGTLFGGQGNQI